MKVKISASGRQRQIGRISGVLFAFGPVSNPETYDKHAERIIKAWLAGHAGDPVANFKFVDVAIEAAGIQCPLAARITIIKMLDNWAVLDG